MTPAESELIEASRNRVSAARGAVCAERLGPLLPEIRQCIRALLTAQKQLAQFSELPGFGGDSGACATIWSEVERELEMAPPLERTSEGTK
jgi:hypothetical protein